MAHRDTKVENIERQVERDPLADSLKEGMVANLDRAIRHKGEEATQMWREHVGDN